MAKSQRNIVFVLPHLRVNTTSVFRFKSIIQEAYLQGHNIYVLDFVYPLKKSKGLGQQLEYETELEPCIKDNLISINVELNTVQKAAYYFLNHFDKPIWKIFNWLHQILYLNDIFHPGSNLPQLDLDRSKETLVIAFGGPFWVFSYAYNLSTTYKGKLVLDYRDPWTFGYKAIDSLPFVHSVKRALSRKREEYFLEKATLIITVSNTLKSYFPERYLYKVDVFENGTDYNLQDIKSVETDVFFILYSGTIYNVQLQDDVFFNAFKAFIRGKDPNKIKWCIVGGADNANLSKKIQDFELMDYVKIIPRVTRKQLLEYLNSASVFLHLRYGGASGIITSKQSDYLFFKKPILLPVSDGGDIEESIMRHQAGYVCNSVEQNLKALQQLWDSFQKRGVLCVNESKMYVHLTRKEIAFKYIERLASI